MWRIGFLVLPAEHSASRAALISGFAEKIKMKERSCAVTKCDEIRRSIKLLARGSKMHLNCRNGIRNENTFSPCG
jgi:hypothetical protein